MARWCRSCTGAGAQHAGGRDHRNPRRVPRHRDGPAHVVARDLILVQVDQVDPRWPSSSSSWLPTACLRHPPPGAGGPAAAQPEKRALPWAASRVTRHSVRSPLPSMLLTSRFFAGREDSLGTPEHHSVFSDSAASPLPSVFSAAGSERDDSPHTLWLPP